ncbi:hypothetical protein VNO77_42223 [Canavalia gladiata]|uniref:Uncharacterized protein n=1 Tax=Canavalia gladiata TaxID=3824 RepID=A0AAN9K3P5_CANGL
MGSNKALLVLVMLLAFVFVLSAEVAPKDVDETFDKSDGELNKDGLDEMKYRHGGWHGHHGGWHRHYGGWGGWRRGYCSYGCCRRNYYGRCIRCCYYANEQVDADVDAEPLN